MAARVLVFGRSGQVARALAAADFGIDVAFAGRETLDLAGPRPDIAGLIALTRAAAVINAAAFTGVDGAETDAGACGRLNRDAPLRMGEACAGADIPLVHFSTDYVFDGDKGAPYVEADPCRPLNVYGRTKMEGEAALETLRVERGLRVAVIRTSWVFSPTGPGFLQTMLRLARDRDSVSVVDDQIGRPTAAASCAESAVAIARRLLDHDCAAEGLVHAAGPDDMSWADFAEAIYRAGRGRGLPTVPVRRISTAEYPTAAVRPHDTRLDCSRLEALTGLRASTTAESLDDCFSRMELI